MTQPGEVRPYVLPQLTGGTVFRLTMASTAVLHPAAAARTRRLSLVLHDHWYPLEDFGAWMNGQQGSISFQTDCGPDRAVVVFLKLRSPPWPDGNVLSIHGEQAGLHQVLIRQGPDVATRLKTRTNRAGEVRLRLSLARIPVAGESDTRALGVGVMVVAFAAADDWPARAEISEDLLFV